GSSQGSVLPIAQLASVTGVYGVSFLVALVSAAAAVLGLSRRPRQLIAVVGVVAVLAAVTVGGMLRLADNRLAESGRVLRVGLIQGNVEQDQKWDPRFRDAIVSRYLTLSREAILSGAQLVVWPEASTPFFIDRDSALAEPIRTLAEQTRTPFVIGTDEFDGTNIFNAASVIGADGRGRGSYRKMHLVPFGEYVPLKKLLFFVGPLVEAVSDFAPGTEASVLDVGEGVRASVAICYESTYPSLTRAFAQGGAQLLLVITNDAWFGTSSAAYQHFQMGAMRAIENGRYLARAANTGITAVVDPYGRVVKQAGMFEPLGLTADVRLLDSRTIYTRTGDLMAWLCAALTACVAVVLRRRA
nr:apolipoprotein N-acyltransferase [Acidobacteriota bacterium]